MYILPYQQLKTTPPTSLQRNCYIPTILIALTIILAIGALIAHFTGLGLIVTSAFATASSLVGIGTFIYFISRCCCQAKEILDLRHDHTTPPTPSKQTQTTMKSSKREKLKNTNFKEKKRPPVDTSDTQNSSLNINNKHVIKQESYTNPVNLPNIPKKEGFINGSANQLQTVVPSTVNRAPIEDNSSRLKGMDIVPAEITAHTFSFLELPDLHNAMLVCKNWYNIISGNPHICLSPAFKKAWGVDLPSERVAALSFIDEHFGILFMRPNFIIENLDPHIFTDHRLIGTLSYSDKNRKSVVIYDLQTQSQHVIWTEECSNIKMAYQKENGLLVTAINKKNKTNVAGTFWEIKVWDVGDLKSKQYLSIFSYEGCSIGSLHLEDNKMYCEVIKGDEHFIDIYEINNLKSIHPSKITIDLPFSNVEYTLRSQNNVVTIRKKIIYSVTNTVQGPHVQATDIANSSSLLPFQGSLFAISNNTIVLYNPKGSAIRIYDLETQKLIKEHKTSFFIIKLTIAENIVAASSETEVFIWNIANNKKIIRRNTNLLNYLIEDLIVKGSILTLGLQHSERHHLKKTALWDLKKLFAENNSTID